MRFLLLEDSDDDADLVLRTLYRAEFKFEHRRVESEVAFRRQLEDFSPDLILSDYALPGYDGHTALLAARELAPQTPFIFVSGTMGEEIAIEALKRGATDYVLKERLARLGPVVRRALKDATEYRQRMEAEARLRYQAGLLQNVSDAIISADLDFTIRTWNKAAEMIYGWTAEEVIGRSFPQVVPTHYPEKNREQVLRHLKEEGFWKGEVIQQRKDGAQLHILSASSLIYDDEGRPTGVVAANRNITEQKRAEEELVESRALYHAIISCSPFPILSIDLEGNILTWNEAAEQVFGWTAVEVLDKANPIVPLQKADEFARLRARVMAGETFTGTEIVRQNKQGEALVLRLSAAPIRDAQGEIVAIMASFEDVTEQRLVMQQAEQERAAQMRRLQQILETVPDGVVLLDVNGYVTSANPAGQTLLQRLADVQLGEQVITLAGRPLQALLQPPVDAPSHDLQYAGGHFELLARPLTPETAESDWVLLLRDVTVEYEREEYLQAQQRLATIGQLAAGIAHDFNNVMAVIILYAQMLNSSENLSEKGQKQLATIRRQAQHAADMIAQILDFSRRSMIERVPLDLLPLLKELVRLLQNTLPETIQINLKYGDGDFVVLADPTRLQQALMNAAVNARDAMPQGGELTFSLSTLAVAPDQPPPLPDMMPGDWLRLQIIDSGIGIASEHLPRIFEPFFTTKAPGKGTGLGLAQLYGIIKQHGGSVDVFSRVGEGTTFTVYLPLLILPAGQETEEDSTVPTGAETILLVEDSDTLRYSLVEALSGLGYHVLEAENGVQAMVILARKHEQVELVISDVVMPEMGGAELSRMIRQEFPTMPVLLMTGYPLTGQESDLAGAAWMMKPFTVQQLGDRIRELVRPLSQS